MGGLATCREVQKIVLANFDKDTYPYACVTERDDVLTLRRKEHGTQNFFVDTSKMPGEPLLLEGDWMVVCQAVSQSIGL